MTQPSDTDRIIAAHRDEARRTRRTVVGTLVGIFVGLPLFGLIVWGIAAAVHQPSSGDTTTTDTAVNCASAAAPEATIDLSACPLSGPALDESSSCAAFNTAEDQAAAASRTNPADAFMSDLNITDRTAFETQCALHPDEPLGAVVEYVETPPTP